MALFNVPKAVQWNPYYARKTGWPDRYDQVITELGFHNICPGEEQFAAAVYQWQKRHPSLKADGMLGPNTWRKLEPQTRYSVNLARPRPVWLSRPAPTPPSDDPARELSTNIWFGLGGSYGGHFFAIGKNAGHAVLFSADDYNKRFVLTTENWRFGPGLGGSWGIALMVISSLRHPSELNSHTGSGFDFTIGLGTRWGEVVKKLKHSSTVKRIIDRAKQAEDAANNPITKHLLKLSLSDWMAIKGRIKELVDASGMKTDDAVPNMMAIGIPVPFSALEVSGYWGFSLYRVESMSGPIAPL